MKVKRLILGFVFMISCFCFVGCKDKNASNTGTQEPQGKQNPTITVKIDETITWHKGDVLSDIGIFTLANSTDGIVVWDNPNYVLEYGENVCAWTFTPTDTNKYNTKTGTITIDAERELTSPGLDETSVKISSSVVYIDSTLKYVELSDDFISIVEGSLDWENPDQPLSEGENSCRWVFTPTDAEHYSKARGTLTVSATAMQYIDKIEVKTNSKDSGYRAYDKFDTSGLTLNLIYNAGKIEPVSNIQDVGIVYNTGDSFKRGDTKVKIEYLGHTCDVEVEAVDYKLINKPVFASIVVYDGNPKNLTISTSNNYIFESLVRVDAGDYTIEVTLKDTENLKWIGSDEEKVLVTCTIQKAEQTINTNSFVGEYDGESHSSSILSNGAERIYYSKTELTSDNYQEATAEVGFIDAGVYKLYYYAVGDKNHLDKSGDVEVEISKQTPTLSLDSVYTIETGSQINYHNDFVKITNKQNKNVEVNNLRFSYYSQYSTESGADNTAYLLSSAPQSYKSGGYFVLVEYLGDNKNYEVVSGVANLFIDSVNNGFYATANDDKFAFKDDAFTSTVDKYSINGSTKECGCYLEFNAIDKNQYGLIELGFIAKFETGEEKETSGKLSYQNGSYVLLVEDGNVVKLAMGEDKSQINVDFTDTTKTLKKWNIPKYLKTFTAQTVEDDDDSNENKITTIKIYNDYGTIRFWIVANAPLIEGAIGSSGGSAEWAGVVESRLESDMGLKCKLNCYITNNFDGKESVGYRTTSDNMFTLQWAVVDALTGDPTGLELVSSNTDLVRVKFKEIMTTYTAQN